MQKFLLLVALTTFAALSFGFVPTLPSRPASKALVFPVGSKKSSVGSFWGDARDGGKRKHEGIDIFAREGTPVVAICDGVITSRDHTPRGGKTLWLRASSHPWTAYYAHLDKQMVREGQFVRKGQVIGTVGNTGNAKTTPAHLHFGIYTWKGAVNPLPYVKAAPKIVAPASSRSSGVKTKAKAPANKSVKSGSLPKYAIKALRLSSDPAGKYYVTTRANVVRLYQGKLQMVGKWTRHSGGTYPYRITLAGNKQLYVTKSGKILNAKGIQIGTLA